MKTFIEVESFGDFDMKYTECIMTHPDKVNKGQLMQEFYQFQGIKSNEDLPYNQLRQITQDFIGFLELKGFTKLETQKVIFSD